MQINAGLVRLDKGTYRGQDYIGCEPGQISCKGNTGMDVGPNSQIVIVVCITVLTTASVAVGLERGIKVLSQAAFLSGTWILLCILFMDETWYILNALTSAIGYYIWYLPKISFHTDAWEELGSAAMGLGGAPDDRGGTKGWMNGWTIFYWGWWISWGPFVGTFLARVGKGRRLGPFIVTSLILGVLTTFLYVGIIGSAQIRISNAAPPRGWTCLTTRTPTAPREQVRDQLQADLGGRELRLGARLRRRGAPLCPGHGECALRTSRPLRRAGLGHLHDGRDFDLHRLVPRHLLRFRLVYGIGCTCFPRTYGSSSSRT